MSRPKGIITLAAVLAVVPTVAHAASSDAQLRGRWQQLRTGPLTLAQGPTGVWTGRQLILVGRTAVTTLDSRGNPYTIASQTAAEAYDPVANRWTRLSPPSGPEYVPGYKSVWTGKEMLAFGAFQSLAYNPLRNVWRELPRSVAGGIVVWTGREAIGWGGGCCGDAQANGTAYNPTSNTYRGLPHSPLAPSQSPLGAWTGKELLLLVSGYSPDGKPYPATLARAAAYNPATNTWRRLASLPDAGLRFASAAVWNGRELLVVGVGESARSVFAFDPAANRWHRRASLPASRVGSQAVWTGRLLLLFAGQNPTATQTIRSGFAYDPRTNRWSTIAAAPLGVAGVSAVWTGHSLIVAGSRKSAAFTPAR